jgi:RNase P/RNase MRP subunit POP5
VVVKEKRGRKRYILFNHAKGVSKDRIAKILSKEFEGLGGKIMWKLINYDSRTGIVRVDHKVATRARVIMNQSGTEFEVKTLRTSGTLKGLKKE